MNRKEYGHDKHSFWIANRSIDPTYRNIDFNSLSREQQEALLVHDTEHTFMINTIFVSDSKLLKNNAIEIPYIYQNQERTLRFFSGQNGAKFTCESYCRVLGRGHTYLTLCHHESERRKIQSEMLGSASFSSDTSIETRSGKKSSSFIHKSPSENEVPITPKNSEATLVNKSQFNSLTPNNTSTGISGMSAQSGVPRSRSFGSYLSNMGNQPVSTNTIPPITIENNNNTDIIHSGIGGVPKSGIPKANTTIDGIPKINVKSISPGSNSANNSTLLGVSAATGVSHGLPPISPRNGSFVLTREDSMVDGFEENDQQSEEDSCPFTGELSLMATGRRHSSMKCEVMDELKHDKFWELSGFVDPCKKVCMSQEEMKEFNLCRVQSIVSGSNSPQQCLEYCKRHVSHEVLDSSSLDYVEDVSLLAERFPAKEAGCVFSPSGHLFKALENSGFHHYIFIDISRNMTSQDMCPSLPVFKPATKSLKHSEKSEDYSHFTAYDNRLGCAIEVALRLLQILYKLRPSDRMTVAVFNKKSVDILIDNDDLQYYYSLIDLVTNHTKKPDNDGGYEEMFALLLDLLQRNHPKSSNDPNKMLKPKVYMLTGNHIESRFTSPSFGKTASSSTGTPVWHSLGKLESLSLQRKKKKEHSKLDEILEWFESNGFPISGSSSGDSEPYISIVKIGNEGNESALNQILLKGRALSTIIDSTLISVNVVNNLTEEEKEDIKKRQHREPAVMQRKIICKIISEILEIHLEQNKIKLNENMRISGANSSSAGKCGLLIKSAIAPVLKHEDLESCDSCSSESDEDSELAELGFGSFMIGKKQKIKKKRASLNELDKVATRVESITELDNLDSISSGGEDQGDSSTPITFKEERPTDQAIPEKPITSEKTDDDKQLQYEKDNMERENLAKEMLDTERAYVTSMAKIIELFYYPLVKYLPQYMLDEDKSKIFGGLLGIYQLHQILVTDLEERVNEWRKDQKIADIFIKLHQTFKLYTSFSSKYEAAIEAFAKYKDNPRIRNFLYIRRKDPVSKGEQLQGFLIKPIQRIPRIILLLKGLLKHTRDPKHPDYDNLVKAISITEEVATFLNNKIRERQYFHRMKSVADRLSGISDLIQPQRRYICEFDKLLATYDNVRNEECVLFLFNDLFIHAVRPLEQGSDDNNDEDKKSGKLSRVKRKLSTKKLDTSHITITHKNTETSTSSLPIPRETSTSETNTPKITSEGAGGQEADNVDIMGILEQSKQDKYEARIILSLGDINLHPLNFGSENESRFQVSTISRKFMVEYDVSRSRNDKLQILSKITDAVNNYLKRKQSFQTDGK